jgi:hypothetical protein
MAIKIAGRDVTDNWIDFAVRYPDGEIMIVESEEDADAIIRLAEVVGVRYGKMRREVFVTDWEPV